MQEFFKDFFNYNHQMNQQVIATCIANTDKVSEKTVKWLSHILNAHQIWNNRILKQQESYSVWQVHSLGYLKDIDADSYQHTLQILAQNDFSRPISYVNSHGKAYTNTVQEILLHVVNHSTYHRGQIASDHKNTGIEPAVTDYIFFKR